MLGAASKSLVLGLNFTQGPVPLPFHPLAAGAHGHCRPPCCPALHSGFSQGQIWSQASGLARPSRQLSPWPAGCREGATARGVRGGLVRGLLCPLPACGVGWCQPGGRSPLTASATATRCPLGSGDRARASRGKLPQAWTPPQPFTSSRDSGATSPETCHLSEMTLTLLPTFSFFSALAACLQMGCHTSEPKTQQRESVSAHPCC